MIKYAGLIFQESLDKPINPDSFNGLALRAFQLADNFLVIQRKMVDRLGEKVMIKHLQVKYYYYECKH